MSHSRFSGGSIAIFGREVQMHWIGADGVTNQELNKMRKSRLVDMVLDLDKKSRKLRCERSACCSLIRTNQKHAKYTGYTSTST
jgi:hypothetical protein